MISIDQVLLGLVVIGFLSFIPLGMGLVGMLLYGTRPVRGRRSQ